MLLLLWYFILLISFLLYENIDPILGSLTPLECALDGYQKLSRMAEEIFGSGIFCSGKQKQKENKTGEEITIVNTHNLLLTEHKGRTGKYWPEVVAVRTERTKGQYSQCTARVS